MSQEGQGRGKILIVDDNRVALRSAQLALETVGYDVLTRSEPLGTTAAAIRERPDLILIDVNMPAIKGSEIVKSIRRCGSLQDVMILLYSSESEEQLIQLTAECGADGYVCKSQSIVKAIDAVFRQRRLSGPPK